MNYPTHHLRTMARTLEGLVSLIVPFNFVPTLSVCLYNIPFLLPSLLIHLPQFLSLFFSLHMSVCIASQYQSKEAVLDGQSGSFPVPRGRISTVPGLPARHRPPLDHHLQPKRHLLLLLPLGQAPIPPSILLPRLRSPPILSLQA